MLEHNIAMEDHTAVGGLQEEAYLISDFDLADFEDHTVAGACMVVAGREGKPCSIAEL